MSKNIYSGIDTLPGGQASDDLTPGCLVLEGGALRGIYSVGVMDALMEAGINIQCTIGVSAGALNGISYVSGQIGRSARIPLRYRHDPRYFGMGAFLRNGSPFGFDFMFNEIAFQLEPLDVRRFMDPQRHFVAVATNCLTGQSEYFEKGEDMGAIFLASRASSTMPYISRMVDIHGVPYLDGGCSCKIPYEWALAQGYKKIVVIRTYPADFRRKEGGGRAARLAYRKFPALAASLAASNRNYNRQCDELERLQAEGRLFSIAPSRFEKIARLESDMEKLGGWYWLGYRDMQTSMDKLKAYLEQE